MYVTFHSAIGASVALAVFPYNAPAAFLLGWASHYLLDAIPHGDDMDESLKADWNKRVRHAAAWGAGDLTVLAVLAIWWVSIHGWSWTFAAAVVGSCLPDLMWGFAAVIGKPGMFGLFGRLHVAVHNFLEIKLPLWFGLTAQVLAAAFLWWNLLFF